MKAVIQRVLSAKVDIAGSTEAQIGAGLLLLVGFKKGDRAETIPVLVNKILNIRIFADPAGKLNLSVADIGGAVLIVPNFTIYGNALSGRRPDFCESAGYGEAKILFDTLSSAFTAALPSSRFGVFGADMQVSLTNDGPVTMIMEL